MNKVEYNQMMINYLSKVHSKSMETCIDYEVYGIENRHPIHGEVRQLIGRELAFAAQEAEAARCHALRFNHVLNRQARMELMKRKHAARKAA